ncbi:HEPN domain-containing protein [Deferrisoma palaeochoriense]
MRNSIEEGLRWWEQAREDLRWAEHLAREGGYHLACFLAQQVAEKALKAVRYAEGAEIVLGHSVERLTRELGERHPGIREPARRWSVLDGYYIPTRYPNGLPAGIPARVYDRDTAERAVALAREVVAWAGEQLAARSG